MKNSFDFILPLASMGLFDEEIPNCLLFFDKFQPSSQVWNSKLFSALIRFWHASF